MRRFARANCSSLRTLAEKSVCLGPDHFPDVPAGDLFRREAEALGGVLAVGDVAPHAEEPDGLADGVEQRGVEGRLVEAEQRWGSDVIGCLRC